MPIGKPWVGPALPCSYGEIKGTRARDGDRVDAYISPDRDSPKVWVIDQIKPSGAYDECKVMFWVPQQGCGAGATIEKRSATAALMIELALSPR